MDALKRNSRINVTYFPSDNEFNTNQLKGKFDIILLYENWNYNVPDKLIGIDNIGIFHVQKALFFNKEGNISSEDMNLLLYYHNRLEGYNLSITKQEII